MAEITESENMFCIETKTQKRLEISVDDSTVTFDSDSKYGGVIVVITKEEAGKLVEFLQGKINE